VIGVDGQPVEVGGEGKGIVYSEVARDWVARCLVKEPSRRATYAELCEHPFLRDERNRDVEMVGWVQRALAHRGTVKTDASTTSTATAA